MGNKQDQPSALGVDWIVRDSKNERVNTRLHNHRESVNSAENLVEHTNASYRISKASINKPFFEKKKG